MYAGFLGFRALNRLSINPVALMKFARTSKAKVKQRFGGTAEDFQVFNILFGRYLASNVE